jgi:hypothetical protein
MNTYAKYCPNVWLAKCETEHAKGDIIQVANKYGKETDCEVHNLVVKNSNGFFYSITRCDGLNRQTYAEKKAEKYNAWAASLNEKADSWASKAREGSEFLSLAEPIKVGHHSEGRHRALIARNHARMDNCVASFKAAENHAHKAAYWESRKNDIDLSMPESIDYFTHELEKAKARHAGLKDGTIERTHGMALQYANKAVKDIEAKVKTAAILWG